MAQDSEQFEEAESGSPPSDLTEALAGAEVDFVADEKSAKGAGSLILFALVLAAAGGTYFMYLKTGPKTAAASAETTAANTTIKQFLSNGPVSLKMMEEMRKNTEKVVERFSNYPSMTQVPLTDLKTNPFRMVAAVPTADLTEAAARRRHEQDRQAALEAVQSLTLQSVMVSSAQSACMINKTLYTEGQQVDIFTIEKIANNAVIVKANGFRFELKMVR